MSRHVPRRDRWTRQGPDRYRSIEGLVARLYKGKWWAEIAYRLRSDDDSPSWETHLDTLGPFPRPRNAMVEAERHLTSLQNRHGGKLQLGTDDALG